MHAESLRRRLTVNETQALTEILAVGEKKVAWINESKSRYSEVKAKELNDL